MASAAPFVPCVRKGLQLVSGASGDNVLEIGLDKTFQAPATGFYGLVAADRRDTKTPDLTVAADDHRLLLRGRRCGNIPGLCFVSEA